MTVELDSSDAAYVLLAVGRSESKSFSFHWTVGGQIKKSPQKFHALSARGFTTSIATQRKECWNPSCCKPVNRLLNDLVLASD